jgi:GalNAc5-diNAcBac-PP-undecaprenol beta-1,3-glucosyltransferase
MKPFFSIITPVYNRADLVGETIETVLNQDFKDFEYILVDDKSPDHSLDILEKYAQADYRIKIIKHEINQGRCIARNSGIEHASGEWICFLDSDDFYHANHLTVLRNLIQQFPDIKAFATEQTWNKKPKPYNNKRHLQDNVILTIEDFISSNPISSNQLCYHNSLKTRWVNERLPISEDWLYHRQLSLEAPILKTRTVTTDVRIHEGRSLDQTDVETFVKWNLYAANKFVELEISKLDAAIKNQILGFIHLLCANILLSQKKKKEGWQVFKAGLKYKSVFKFDLFYKAILKFALP